jgi:hypothetical protein
VNRQEVCHSNVLNCAEDAELLGLHLEVSQDLLVFGIANEQVVLLVEARLGVAPLDKLRTLSKPEVVAFRFDIMEI